LALFGARYSRAPDELVYVDGAVERRVRAGVMAREEMLARFAARPDVRITTHPTLASASGSG
jgi:hypothetical protein